MPEGADITIVDSENTFVSGADGQVFVSEVPEQFTGKVIWGGGGCTFNVTLPKPKEDDPIPDIGVITCKALVENHATPATTNLISPIRQQQIPMAQLTRQEKRGSM